MILALASSNTIASYVSNRLHYRMRSSNVIGIPESSEAFEDRCAVLFQRVINDPCLKGVATSGSDQEGIDLIGNRDGDPRKPVSIQCKLKKRQDRLSVAEAKSDIVRALRIEPPLTEIFVVTTAPDHIVLDKLAIELRQEQADLGRTVQIQLWGWNELQRRIRQFPEAMRAFDPEYNASTDELLELGQEGLEVGRRSAAELTAIRSDQEVIASGMQEMLTLLRSPDTGGGAALDRVYDEQIDALRDLLNRGRPNTAAEMLIDLEARLPYTASAAVRSRIRANLGFARMSQGRDEEAARLLWEAFDLNPLDPKTRANRLLALILEGQLDEAVEGSRLLLEEDPGNAIAASYAYQAAAMQDDGIDPDVFVPSELRSDENTAINRLNLLRRRGDHGWRAAAQNLLTLHPDSALAQRFAAEALLDEAFDERAYDLPPARSRDRRTRIEQAAELLQRHWDQVRVYENASEDVWAGVGVNLVTAYRSLRRREDARRVADQVLAVAPAWPDALVAAAHLDVIEDRPAKAIERVEALDESPARTMVMLAALADTPNWPAVVEFATAERRESVSAGDRSYFDTLLSRAKIETAAADPGTELLTLVDLWSGEQTVLAAAAQVARVHAPALADELKERLLTGLHPDTAMSARVMAAELALDMEDAEGVIGALDGFVDTGTMSDPVAWLAWAYANAPVTPRTRAFFEGLPEEVLAVPRIARLAGAAANGRGDVDAAERHLQRALDADPNDLRARLILHGVYMRSDRRELAQQVIRSVDEGAAVGTAMDRMRLALLLRRAGEDLRAFDLAYVVASRNRAEEAVVQMYPGLFFLTDRMPAEVRMIGPAAVGDWFELEEVDGGRMVQGILSTEATPEVVSYPPDQPLALHVLGRSAGDEIVMPQGIGEDRRYRIKEVKHRFVWLLHDILHTHATRFPQSRSMGSMTMREGDVQPVLDVARQHQQHALEICRSYRELSLPLAALAAINRINVLQIAELIPQHGGEVRTCLGDQQEREDAERACAEARGRGAVLDTLTAWCAHHLGLLNPLRDFFGSLAIAQATLDELIEARANEELNDGREYMTIGYQGGQPVRQVHSPKDTQRRVAMFTEAVDSLREHCEILPADGSDDPELARLLHREVVESILDPLLIAKQSGRLLLSDDLHFRQLAAGQGVERTAWLQAAARAMLAEDDLGRDAYALCVARLASLRHGHVSLDGDTFLEMLGHPDGHILIETAGAYIGGPRAEMFSHCFAVADFINRAWASGVPSWQVGRSAGGLITRLISNRDDWWETLEKLNEMFGRTGGQMPRPDRSRFYLQSWIRGHFLRKPTTETQAKRSRKRRR